MITIEGQWHPHGFSEQHPAALHCDHFGHCHILLGDKTEAQAGLSDMEISDRLGKLPRRLSFASDGIFITDNNETVDELLKQFGVSSWTNKLHFLESNLKIVLISFALLIVSVFAIGKYGVPFAAQKVANSIPQELLAVIEESTLQQLDDGYLNPSKLSQQRQTDLQNYFAAYETAPRQVIFREGETFIGANAFALPDKTIVFTDQIVALSEHDQELLSIYFHETGHVLHRHGVRTVLQSSSIALFITFITGDGSGIAEVIYAVPIILAHSAYSRKFETESDDHAYQQLRENDIPLHRFADIMARLESQHSSEKKNNDQTTNPIGNYFSSHPNTGERIKRFANP